MPAGRPKRCQLVLTASMPKRTRSSRVTMPMISSLPPCELTTTIFLTPARATEAPSSVQASISVGGRQRQRARRVKMLVRLADRLHRQDADVEIVRQAGDDRVEHAVHDLVSVETGRCGPCCSIAATGSIAMVASGSIAAYSVVR